MTDDLWPHQAEAIVRVMDAFHEGQRRVVLQLPTGGGKTRVASRICKGFLDAGHTAAFSVPALSLINQTVEKFRAVGLQPGVIQATHEETDPSRPLQICSAQTLAQRSEFPPAAVVLIDEVHVWHEVYERWMFTHPETFFVGLSATPWRRGLGARFERLIVGCTMADLTPEYLTPFRIFAPAHPDLQGVRVRDGDYVEDDLAEAMNRPSLVADVVTQWLSRGENRPTLCFAVNRAHAKAIERSFAAKHVPVAYIDAETPIAKRDAILDQLEAGHIKIVVNVGTLLAGVDRDVRCIILARPTRSRMLFVQLAGRGTRQAPGKENCLLLDHSDTVLRLGMPADIHQSHLDDGKGRNTDERQAASALPKECPVCAYVRPASVSVCPSCGHKPAAEIKVQSEDGELVELFGIQARSLRGHWVPVEERHRIFGMLKHYARSNHHHRGWAKEMYIAFMGVYPDGIETCLPVEPNSAMLAWINENDLGFSRRISEPADIAPFMFGRWARSGRGSR